MNNQEFKFDLSMFEESVPDGPVSFFVLKAEYDSVLTKSGKEAPIVKLQLEIQELNNPAGEKEIANINVFVDYNPRSQFYKFAKAVTEALSTTSFEPQQLINLKGEAVMS